MLRINVGGYSVEGANPRHEHEWRVWEEVKLPEGRMLIPGVISHATNIVEHPELVAERIVRLAEARRPRARHRRHRLRLRPGSALSARPPVDHVGETRSARRGSTIGLGGIVRTTSSLNLVGLQSAPGLVFHCEGPL